MAMSATLQSVLLRPAVTGSAKRARLNLGFPAPYYVPTLRRSGSLRVRSAAENDQEVEPTPVSKTTVPPQPPRANPAPPPKPKAKVSTKFSDVLAFSGPAPERINGRLAMIGFVAAMAVEIANGEDLLTQISNGGIPWFLGTSIVLSLASLVPLFRGVSVESESGGFMSPEAELWNGRFAMLGLVALAFTEYVKGGALV